MHGYKKPDWVHRSSEMLAGLLGGINAAVAWLIVLGSVVAGFVTFSAVSDAGMAALLSGVGLIAMGLLFAVLLCGLVAVLYVIMTQAQYQSWLLRQILNQQTRQTEILEVQNRLMRTGSG